MKLFFDMILNGWDDQSRAAWTRDLCKASPLPFLPVYL